MKKATKTLIRNVILIALILFFAFGGLATALITILANP
jgi:uncharacterized membrane protein YdfJ with MMPL/SSD domain